MAFVLEIIANPSSLLLHLAAGFCLLYLLLKATQLYCKRQRLRKAFESFPAPPSHWFYGHTIRHCQCTWGSRLCGKRNLQPAFITLSHFQPQSFTHVDSPIDLTQVTRLLTVKRVFQLPKLSQDDELNNMLSWAKQYPYAYPRWLGAFMATLVINHPDYAKAVFGHGDPKGNTAYKFLIPWLGKGLLILHGPKWFQHRRLLTPGFHSDVLKSYVPMMADSVQVMLDNWEKLITLDRSVELFQHVSLMALDSIMKCAFSCHSNCQTDSDSNSYIKAVYDLTYLVFHRFRFYPFHNDFIYRLSPQGRRFREACRVAHLHTENVIKERKKSLQDQQELEKTQKKKCLDFLDILLCARDENGIGLSDEDLRAEVDTFMFEGHDTTTSGISWILYCMAIHPEHQQRCREEIKEILGNRDTVEWNDLGKMTYSTMCIKESLRLYPPVPQVSRELIKPITFFDGRTLPEGSRVVMNIYSIHRNPSIWQDPEVFDPMRFSPENSSKRHPYAFIPFAAGARNCIGQQFAMNELKVALALTLLRFELSPDPAKPPKPIPQVILRSRTGIHLFLKKLH